MKKEFKINRIPSEVIQDGYKIKIFRNSDLISYQQFLHYFKNVEKIEKEHLIIGINFTYAWMPTIFEFTSQNFDQGVELLNKAKNNVLLSKTELLVLKSMFNNSLVGTSKLLHFINPELYPIWDSRVYHYLTKSNTINKISDPQAYHDYISWANKVIIENGFNEMKIYVENLVGYSMSNIRVVEFVLYSFGKINKS